MVSERRQRVAVTDTKTGEAFELPVREGEGEGALEVFRHPDAYARAATALAVPIAAFHSS